MVSFGQNVVEIVIAARDRFTKVFSKASLSLQKFRTAAIGAAAVGVGIVAGFGKAIQASMNFDSAMTKSTAIMGDLSDVMKTDMRNAAREMAKTTTFSATQAADSYFFLASAGLDAEASIAALPTVAQFAQAGMFDMALATDLLTDAQSALGLTIRDDAIKNMENMVKISDILVKANTLANASVQQFSEALTSEAGAALKSYNKDVEEGVAVLASMADQGVKGQKAGTDLSRIMRLLSKAALDNQDELNALGIEIFDSTGKMKNFADIIGDMETTFEGMSDKQRAAALDSIGFTARVQGVILPLLGTSDAIREYEKQLRIAGGTTKTVANKQLESFKEQVGLTKSALVDIGIEIGDKLVPFLRDYLIPAIKGVIDWWKNLSPRMQDAILIFAGVTAAVFLLAGAVALLTIVASPWLLILLGIAAAITGIILITLTLRKNWEEFVVGIKGINRGLRDSFINVFFGIKKTIMVVFATVKNFIFNIWNSIVKFIENRINNIITAINVLIRGINAIAGALGLNRIELFSKVSLGGMKAELEDISALKKSIESSRTIALMESAREFDKDIQSELNVIRARGTEIAEEPKMTINIENIYGTDPSEIAQALNDKLSDNITI